MGGALPLSDSYFVTEHQRDTAFLRQCLRYDDSAERHELEERIAQVQRKDRCVQRAVWLMILLTGLSGAGLAYGAVLQENFSYGEAWFVVRLLCEIGLASLICLVAFVGLFMVYRMELNRLREQCRRLATTLLESRLGNPAATSLTGVVQAQELTMNHNKVVVSAAEMAPEPRGLMSQ